MAHSHAYYPAWFILVLDLRAMILCIKKKFTVVKNVVTTDVQRSTRKNKPPNSRFEFVRLYIPLSFCEP